MDTADVASLKKKAYSEFKERTQLTLKEFTALNTVGKSQEARLANKVSTTTRQWIQKIAIASMNRLRFLKYALYNDQDVQALTRQEKQHLWDSVRAREAELQVETRSLNQSLQRELFKTNILQQSHVKVTPLPVSAI